MEETFIKVTIRFVEGSFLSMHITQEAIDILIEAINLNETMTFPAEDKTIVINTRNITTVAY